MISGGTPMTKRKPPPYYLLLIKSQFFCTHPASLKHGFLNPWQCLDTTFPWNLPVWGTAQFSQIRPRQITNQLCWKRLPIDGLVGGPGPPLWKIWKSSGMMKFPIYGKIENGNQTTNQWRKSTFLLQRCFQTKAFTLWRHQTWLGLNLPISSRRFAKEKMEKPPLRCSFPES